MSEIPKEIESDPQFSLIQSGNFPEDPMESLILGNKVVVFRPLWGALLYGYNRYFGSPMGIQKPKSHLFNRPLQLSLFEALYLMKKTRIIIKDPKSNQILSQEEFNKWADTKFPGFSDKYIIYEDLRDKKYIPRPGQKFGSDFIVYKQGPGIDHSSFCIEVLPRNHKITSMDVVRAGRLATSVKKRYIMANPITKTYFSFKWFKP
jgi:tRNA-intron endonuclease